MTPASQILQLLEQQDQSLTALGFKPSSRRFTHQFLKAVRFKGTYEESDVQGYEPDDLVAQGQDLRVRGRFIFTLVTEDGAKPASVPYILVTEEIAPEDLEQWGEEWVLTEASMAAICQLLMKTLQGLVRQYPDARYIFLDEALEDNIAGNADAGLTEQPTWPEWQRKIAQASGWKIPKLSRSWFQRRVTRGLARIDQKRTFILPAVQTA